MSTARGSDLQEAPAVPEDTPEVARRYAEALIRAAEHEGVVDQVLEELVELERDVLKPNPRFAQILASTRVSSAEKDRILVDLLENRGSSLLLRFLRVLNRHERLGYLGAVAQQARVIWDKRHARVPVQVRSAFPLDEGQLQALRAQLAKLT